jgi:putative ABC transport system permease protein
MGVDIAKTVGTLNVTGETINVNGTNFTIVGVLESMGTSEEGSKDELVIIPYSTGTRFMQNKTIRTVYIGASSSDAVDTAVESLENHFSKIAYSESGYSVLSQTSILESLSSVADTQAAMLGGIAASRCWWAASAS